MRITPWVYSYTYAFSRTGARVISRKNHERSSYQLCFPSHTTQRMLTHSDHNSATPHPKSPQPSDLSTISPVSFTYQDKQHTRHPIINTWLHLPPQPLKRGLHLMKLLCISFKYLSLSIITFLIQYPYFFPNK